MPFAPKCVSGRNKPPVRRKPRCARRHRAESTQLPGPLRLLRPRHMEVSVVRPLCLEEAEVSLFPVRDFSRRLRIPSEFAYLCKIRKVMDNFIVSARKYRPATFASVVGQSHITSTLRNAIARRAVGPRLPVLRSARRRQNDLRAHFRQGDQLPRSGRRRRGLQRVRVVPGVQRGAARSISTSWTPHRTTRWTIFVR